MWEGGLPVNIKLHFSDETANILLISAKCGGAVYMQNCEHQRTAGMGNSF